MKPVTKLKRRQWKHECPACHRVVYWQLEICAICSWRNFPIRNKMWVRGAK